MVTSKQKAPKKKFLPQEIQKYAEKLVVDLLGIEKEEEYRGKIIKFPHYDQTKECIFDMQKKINRGQDVVKAAFAMQEKAKNKFSKNSNFAVWENIKKSLQEKAQDAHFLRREIALFPFLR